jgi:hypothetical protein
VSKVSWNIISHNKTLEKIEKDEEKTHPQYKDGFLIH